MDRYKVVLSFHTPIERVETVKRIRSEYRYRSVSNFLNVALDYALSHLSEWVIYQDENTELERYAD